MKDIQEMVSSCLAAKRVQEGAGKTIMSAAGSVIFPIWLPYRSIISAFDEKTRRCGIYGINSSNRQACLYKVKIQKWERILAAATARKDEKILAKAKERLAKYKMKYQKLTNALAIKGRVEHRPSAVGSKKLSGFDKGGMAVRTVNDPSTM